MKNFIKFHIALSFVCLFAQSVTAGSFQQHPSYCSQSCSRFDAPQCGEIEKVLKQYERSLNTSNVEGVIDLYTADGVLLAPNAPSAVGTESLRESYTGTFQAISLNILFDIEELKVISPEWAYLRTNSTGVINILGNGAQIPEGNQELFLLRKSRGVWKIARYSFSTFLAPSN